MENEILLNIILFFSGVIYACLGVFSAKKQIKAERELEMRDGYDYSTAFFSWLLWPLLFLGHAICGIIDDWGRHYRGDL